MGTETRKAELEPCVIPKPGSDCYKVIQWAMKDGVSHGFTMGDPFLGAKTPAEKHGNLYIYI